MALVSDRGRRSRVELSLDNCCCPICLEIFIEPVTLPCTHTFCKDCFLQSVDKATLCCPMCRKRVSTWARLHSRNKTLVDQQLWTDIQTNFPLQCQRRLSGQDATRQDEPPALVCLRVSQPGELRKEYEDEVSKLMEEKRAMDEEERRASEEYIQRLLTEEEKLLQEEMQRRGEEDERLARLLSDQLNSSVISQEVVRPDITPVKKKKKEVTVGQMDRFLCPRPSKSSSTSSHTANKENILDSELPLPHLDYYGPDVHEDRHPVPGEDQVTSDEPSSTKRKSSELYEEEEMVSKRLCNVLPPSDSSSHWDRGSIPQGMVEQEAELLSRWQQEEEDRKFALQLQKELDQEEKVRATDRRKGSAEAYLLRQHHRAKEEASTSSNTHSRASSTTSSRSSNTHNGASSTSSRASSSLSSSTSSRASSSTSSRGFNTPSKASAPLVKTKTTSSSSRGSLSAMTTKTSSSSSTTTSSSSSSTTSSRSKQVTLTEMFSSLIS